jgi:uncharacterized protein YjiS (DUF1127 family)
MNSHHSARSQLPLSGTFRRLLEARRRHKSLHALMEIDDYTLRDIGLTRGEVLATLGRDRPR